MTVQLDLTYPAVTKLVAKHKVGSRTESRAFLAWFLENYYRLEEVGALDCICDGPDDRGIDGLYVDDNYGRIDVFQSKMIQNNSRTLGDTQLKEFVGTLTQFEESAFVDEMQETTRNNELSALLADRAVSDKVAQGYEIRGVFLTNATKDDAAIPYVSNQDNLFVYDNEELQRAYIPEGRTDPIQESTTFDLFGVSYSEFQIGQDVRVVFAPVAATDLVTMNGIANQELFAWNVRQSLGKTNVNKEIAQSVQNAAEHPYFLLYHNGLTVLCDSLETLDDKITISGYTVVNGCQSLSSLYEHRDKTSDELRVLTRLIQIPPESDLAFKISHHSNNQNGIRPRDLQSNSRIQARLQEEFFRQYGNEYFYQVKRGELAPNPGTEILDNELAARILLAFDLQEPWSCHQTGKLFDDHHARIFLPALR